MILYLHGFRSGPQSHKAQSLAARMTALGLGARFWCEQLPTSPSDTAARVADVIADARSQGMTPTLVGSSLGGFYATAFAEQHQLRAVLVNPAVVASLTLEPWLGWQTQLYTGAGFELLPRHLAELRALDPFPLAAPERLWLLAERDDEVLDTAVAVAAYRGARQSVFDGGDHSFTRWDAHIDDILRFAGLI